MTPDAHMVETLRLRTAALHRVSRSNDLLRRENDDLRATLERIEVLAKDERRHLVRWIDGSHLIDLEHLREALDGKP